MNYVSKYPALYIKTACTEDQFEVIGAVIEQHMTGLFCLEILNQDAQTTHWATSAYSQLFIFCLQRIKSQETFNAAEVLEACRSAFAPDSLQHDLKRHAILLSSLDERRGRYQWMWLLHALHEGRHCDEVLALLPSPPFLNQIGEALYKDRYCSGYRPRLLPLSFLLALEPYASSLSTVIETEEAGLFLEAGYFCWQKEKHILTEAHVDALIALFMHPLPKLPTYPGLLYRDAYKIAALFGANKAALNVFLRKTGEMSETMLFDLQLLITQLLSMDLISTPISVLNVGWDLFVEMVGMMSTQGESSAFHCQQFIKRLVSQGALFPYLTSAKVRRLQEGESHASVGDDFDSVDCQARLSCFLIEHVVINDGERATVALLPLIDLFNVIRANPATSHQFEPLLAILEQAEKDCYWHVNYLSALLHMLIPPEETTLFPLDALKLIFNAKQVKARSIEWVETAFPEELSRLIKAILGDKRFRQDERTLLVQLCMQSFLWTANTDWLESVYEVLAAPIYSEARSSLLRLLLATTDQPTLNTTFLHYGFFWAHASINEKIKSSWPTITTSWLQAMEANPREQQFFKQIQAASHGDADKQACLLHIVGWSYLCSEETTMEVELTELNANVAKVIDYLGDLSLAALNTVATVYSDGSSPSIGNISGLIKRVSTGAEACVKPLFAQFLREMSCIKSEISNRAVEIVIHLLSQYSPDPTLQNLGEWLLKNIRDDYSLGRLEPFVECIENHSDYRDFFYRFKECWLGLTEHEFLILNQLISTPAWTGFLAQPEVFDLWLSCLQQKVFDTLDRNERVSQLLEDVMQESLQPIPYSSIEMMQRLLGRKYKEGCFERIYCLIARYSRLLLENPVLIEALNRYVLKSADGSLLSLFTRILEYEEGRYAVCLQRSINDLQWLDETRLGSIQSLLAEDAILAMLIEKPSLFDFIKELHQRYFPPYENLTPVRAIINLLFLKFHGDISLFHPMFIQISAETCDDFSQMIMRLPDVVMPRLIQVIASYYQDTSLPKENRLILDQLALRIAEFSSSTQVSLFDCIGNLKNRPMGVLKQAERLLQNEQSLTALKCLATTNSVLQKQQNTLIEKLNSLLDTPEKVATSCCWRDWFDFSSSSPSTVVARMTFMQMVEQGIFLSSQWTPEKNERLLEQGLNEYVGEARRILGVSRPFNIHRKQVLSATQQGALLRLTGEIETLAKNTIPPVREGMYEMHARLIECMEVYNNTGIQWFKLKERRSQLMNLNHTIASLLVPFNDLHLNGSYYQAVWKAIGEARKRAVQTDQQCDRTRRFFKVNRGGESRYLNTLNQMQALVLRYWSNQADSLRDMQAYCTCYKEEFYDLFKLLLNRMAEHIDLNYPIEERCCTFFSNTDIKKSIMSLYDSLKYFDNHCTTVEGITAYALTELMTAFSQQAQQLPGHLKTLADEVMARGDALQGYLIDPEFI